jgi:hypothetical protein
MVGMEKMVNILNLYINNLLQNRLLKITQIILVLGLLLIIIRILLIILREKIIQDRQEINGVIIRRE